MVTAAAVTEYYGIPIVIVYSMTVCLIYSVSVLH